MLYFWITLHGLVLVWGGHYTYARVPFGFWLQDIFDLARNPYDRIGHFFQGFVPALIVREIFIRKSVVRSSIWQIIFVVCLVQTISVFYEYIEWVSALISGQGASEFLGTQGDPWDTQLDMLMALVGACFALMFLSKVQDKQMRKVK